jgi:hypothetical protein
MPTFLTNPKMSPELAARVESSVTGRRKDPRNRASSARVVSLVRGVTMLVIVAVIAWVLIERQSSARRLQSDRAQLLDTLNKQKASLTERDRGAVTRDEAWLLRSSGAYEGDVVADELRSNGLTEVLSRPLVYVHGWADAFTNSAGIARATKSSVKDTLLLCLVDPPTARTEAALLGKVRVSYGAGAQLEQRTSNVRDLSLANTTLHVLSPAFEQSVVAADDLQQLAKLRTEVERAPIEGGRQALTATVMLIAMDEPGIVVGPSELDGERPHDVRLLVIDLTTDKVLLRTRKHVDPSVWSTASRATYAVGLDECAMAFDVRAAVGR